MSNLDERISRILWEWFLQRAKIHDVYGGYMEIPDKVRRHLDECGIDFKVSARPDVGTVSQFADTFSPNDELEAITSDDWRCNCGKYGDPYGLCGAQHQVRLAIPGPYALGDIMAEVTQMAWEERTDGQA